MLPRSIEDVLRAEDADLADKYGIIKRRLTQDLQPRWCARWAEGNDHGPGHVQRVLANLSALLGEDPIQRGRINAFELFLALTAAVAHDIGIIDGRDLHEKRSAELLAIIAKTNTFLFDDHSLQVLGAAIESHRSSTNIDEVCQGFSSTETFVGSEVRPRFVAALVRLSDELDEDRRRAEAWIQDIARVPEASRPYWEFCQRIQGIRIDESNITFDVVFKHEDIGRVVVTGKSGESFVRFFAKKLAKINRERELMKPHLGDLCRQSIVVSVKPVRGAPNWPVPRPFTFINGSCGSMPAEQDAVESFLRMVPELERKKEADDRDAQVLSLGVSLSTGPDAVFSSQAQSVPAPDVSAAVLSRQTWDCVDKKGENRESLVLRAASRGTPGLIDEFERLHGSVLASIYRIDWLANMGSQFAVFRGTNLAQDKPVAIKLPFVDYTRPTSFGRQEIELARSAARREWESLLRHRDAVATLPWPYDLVSASNLMLDGRGSDPVWAQEIYLVEEWIEGASFDDVRQQLYSLTPSGERIMEVVLPLMTSLLSALARLEPELFADVSPRNFIWCNRTKTTRLVDAGSLVAPGTPLWVAESSGKGAAGRITTAVTLPYLSARDFTAYCRGESREVQSTGVLFALGKMFYELATNLHPLNGQDPSLSAVSFASLPRELRDAIDRLLSGTLGSMSAANSAIIDLAGGRK